MNKKTKFEILDKSNLRLKKIINNCNNAKFTCLHSWIDFQSKSFKNENEKHLNKYKKYKRGTIVFVDFGISIGTELSGNHFAIVLNKNDNPVNGSLTVLPLSSKNKKYYIPLETELINRILEDLGNQIDTLTNVFTKLVQEVYGEDRTIKRQEGESIFIIDENVTKYISKYYNSPSIKNGYINIKDSEFTNLINKNISCLKEIIEYYKKYNKSSFAMIDSITTVSKFRIKKPLNYMDPIGKISVSNQILNQIDKAFIDRFTNNGIKNKDE